MADIFISYARVDEERARPIAEALQAQGWEVWWDLASLRTGQRFSKAVEEALGDVKCVIVLWTGTSVDSLWVEAEASWAWRKHKLASVVLDAGLEPPFPFHTAHAQDLSGCAGDTAAPAFRKLVADLTEVLGPPTAAAVPAAKHTAADPGEASKRSPISQSVSAAPATRVRRRETESAPLSPAPSWASASGTDRFGRWVEISIAREIGEPVVQRLRWIAPGTFTMGSPPDEPGRFDDEGPPHLLSIAQGFWLFDTPCTQAMWTAVVGENPCECKDPEHPVVNVAWEDVQQRFIPALNEHTPGFVLPSEAQWEYACRAGSGTALYTGEIEILGENNAPALDPIAWYSGNSGLHVDLKDSSESETRSEFSDFWPFKGLRRTVSGTREVKAKQPNAWGLYDMIGNVCEWCDDAWHNSYEGAPADGSAWQSDEADARHVFRGGSWQSAARFCRSAGRRRGMWATEVRHDYLGFRCVRVQA